MTHRFAVFVCPPRSRHFVLDEIYIRASFGLLKMRLPLPPPEQTLILFRKSFTPEQHIIDSRDIGNRKLEIVGSELLTFTDTRIAVHDFPRGWAVNLTPCTAA